MAHRYGSTGKKEEMNSQDYPYTGSYKSIGPGSKESKADRQQGTEPKVQAPYAGGNRP